MDKRIETPFESRRSDYDENKRLKEINELI